MDDFSRDPLEKILARLDALQQQLDAVNDRIERLETSEATASQVSSADALGFELEVSSGQPDTPSAPPADAGQSIDQVIENLAHTTVAETPRPAQALPEMQPPPLPLQAGQPPPPPGTARFRDKEKLVPARGESLEMRIGSTWLLRIGILALALVLVLFAREHVQGPLGKVIGSYALSAALIAVGLVYEKRFQRWAGSILAGGLAFSYFASYAMGFVEPMRLLDSLPLKLTVVGLDLAVIFAFAQWKKSEAMAGTALVLGYFTTGVAGSDVAALCSCVALSILSVLFLWRNKWFLSTAVAAACSYGAFVYTQKALPHPETQSPAEAFWFQLMFLSLLFLVYVVASWVGSEVLMKARTTRTYGSLAAKGLAAGLDDILTALTQTNLAAYIAAMVWVFYRTEVYWSQAWVFFLPMVGVCAVLGMAFRAVRPIAMVYAIGAAVCLAFGVMSAASPHWLPVFLVLQAVAMLIVAARREFAGIWYALSFLILVYACAYVLLDGDLSMYAGQLRPQTFPWWVHGAVSALMLAYAVVWEKGIGRGQSRGSFFWTLPYIVSALAAVTWTVGTQQLPGHWGDVVACGIVPVSAFVAVGAGAGSLVGSVILGAIISAAYQVDGGLNRSPDLWVGGYWLVILGSFVSGWMLERRGCGDPAMARVMWRVVYLWVQCVSAVVISRYVQDQLVLISLNLVYAATLAAGWALRSAALAKSAGVSLIACAIGGPWMIQRFGSGWTVIAAPLLLAAASWPMGLAHWSVRTGDRAPAISAMVQAAALAVAGLVFVHGMGSSPHFVDRVFLAGAWCLFGAIYAASGLFAMMIPVSIGFAGLAGLILCSKLLDNVAPGVTVVSSTEAVSHSVWPLFGIALIVVAERALKFAPRITRHGEFNPAAPWPKESTSRWITIWMAVGTLAMSVVSLRLVPELRMFYFTGALVAAAFVWVVLGFWFREAIYRQAGLVLLCGGILKGLVWDVLSLKNTMYRQISWTVLGVLAIGASFLYNRFRGRVGDHAD